MTAIKFRRGTSEEWSTIDPVLAAGEPGYETDTGKHKVGDGVSNWSALEYFIPESILATMYQPIGTAPVNTDTIVGALRETNNNVGADLLEAADANDVRATIGAIGVPTGAKIQLVQNFTTLAGFTRVADPNSLYAVEARGPVDPSSKLLNDDSWVIVG